MIYLYKIGIIRLLYSNDNVNLQTWGGIKMTLKDFIIRILVAFVLGTIIGFERQYRHRMAGIRTNALVCVGACLFAMFPILDGSGDRTRIAAQVVSGIGFLGGGVIIREGLNIRGLNTAATLWCAAAIGVLTSEGFIIHAIVGTVIILIANIALRPLARRIYSKKDSELEDEFNYEISVKCESKDEFHIRSLLMRMVNDEDIMLRNLESHNIESGEKVQVKSLVVSVGKNDVCLEKIVGRISLEAGVEYVGWEVQE